MLTTYVVNEKILNRLMPEAVEIWKKPRLQFDDFVIWRHPNYQQ